MDLRSFCSKLDVDTIRAKIPPMPQIKLPKSMSKLKSRKIFSREDVRSDSRRGTTRRLSAKSENLQLGPSYTLPASEFINRTPNRISTISSLVDVQEDNRRQSTKRRLRNDYDNENSYRNAGGIDDYYPPPLKGNNEISASEPVSPLTNLRNLHKAYGDPEPTKMSFGEKLQKGYKDVSEFKLKHIFAKKTLVKADKIEIENYIPQIDNDRKKEEKAQEKLDKAIADNYRFQFKISQQKSQESYIDISPLGSPVQPSTEHPKNHKNLSEQSGDESGMESSPPPRKPGIAATRFAKVRPNPINMSLESDYCKEDNDFKTADDVKAAYYNKQKQQKSTEKSSNAQQSPQKSFSSRSRPIPHNMSLEDEYEDAEDDEDFELSVEEVDLPNKNQKKSKSVTNLRQNTLNKSQEDNFEEVEIEDLDVKPNTSSVFDIKKHKTTTSSNEKPQIPPKTKSIRERVARFTKQKSDNDELNEVSDKKRRAPLSPQQSEENDSPNEASAAPTKSEKPFDTLKQNFKRIQKSVRLPQKAPTSQSGAESENEETKMKQSKSQQFTERLKHFRSSENVNKNSEDGEQNESPIHKIANRLQEWRRTIKKKVEGEKHTEDVIESPQKQGTLMQKLKHIRSRKRDNTEDPDDDEEGGNTYKESLSARAKLQLEKSVAAASQVPQITKKKISETKKFFKKKPETETKPNKPDVGQSDEEDLEIDDEEKEKAPTHPLPKTMPRPPPPIPRPYFHNSSEELDDDIDDQKFITKSIAESKLIAVPAATAAWTTKAILAEDSLDFDEELPRVLLHQDNSDVFESTLIIAVTRPISRVPSPIITELPPDSPEEYTTDMKPDNWIPNKDMVACLMEMAPTLEQNFPKDYNEANNSRGHSRKQSVDYSSDDSWIKDINKVPSIAPLNSLHENEEPWKIQKGNPDDSLYKTKSIDLFEMQKKHGGVLTAFEDFDDELKNTPVVKIEKEITPIIIIENEEDIKDKETYRNVDSYTRESSEELENTDDDNSSRVTKISVHPPQKQEDKNIQKLESENAIKENLPRVTKTCFNEGQEAKPNETLKVEPDLISQAYDNIGESLTGNLDILNKNTTIDSGEEEDNEESENDDEYHDEEEVLVVADRPPSKSPSPPPSKTPTPPPPPPPLPERKSSIGLLTFVQPVLDLTCPSIPPPPLPLAKPPILPNRPAPAPPKIPERNSTSSNRTSKPLVKTASLRLAYSEQVNPEDVGKVNKLISRFEPEGVKQRPRVIARKPYIADESEEYSDEEDLMELLPIKQKEKDMTTIRQMRLQKSFSIDSNDVPNNNNDIYPSIEPIKEISTLLTSKSPPPRIIPDNNGNAKSVPSISISPSILDINSNSSRPSSVYSSPLILPPSFNASKESTPLTNRKDTELLVTRRSRRSLARDDDHFYSFDSDEENSYYSISSTGSNRYVVDL